MDIQKLNITEEFAGERLDALLPRAFPGLTRSAAQRMIEAGTVTVSGKIRKKNYILSLGESVELAVPEPEPAEPQAQAIPLDILYEDADLIVVNKPRGLVVHPAAGHPDRTLVNALLYHCGSSLSGIGGERRPGIVHRLDMDTSGLMVAAKNDAAHQSLSAQLSDHSMFRIYEAVVRGRMREGEGTVDAPIGRHPTERKRMAVTAYHSRPAVTHFEVLARYRAYTHLRCRLETGRTHQIRVHMAYLGHPVAGDPVYGGKKTETGLGGQCLHAKEIEFTHPRSGDRIHLSCPLPDYFLQFLHTLGPQEQ